jgi:hypothetical protein
MNKIREADLYPPLKSWLEANMTNPNIDQLKDYIFKLCSKFRTLSRRDKGNWHTDGSRVLACPIYKNCRMNGVGGNPRGCGQTIIPQPQQKIPLAFLKETGSRIHDWRTPGFPNLMCKISRMPATAASLSKCMFLFLDIHFCNG